MAVVSQKNAIKIPQWSRDPAKFMPDWNGKKTAACATNYHFRTNAVKDIRNCNASLRHRKLLSLLLESFTSRKNHSTIFMLLPHNPVKVTTEFSQTPRKVKKPWELSVWPWIFWWARSKAITQSLNVLKVLHSKEPFFIGFASVHVVKIIDEMSVLRVVETNPDLIISGGAWRRKKWAI